MLFLSLTKIQAIFMKLALISTDLKSKAMTCDFLEVKLTKLISNNVFLIGARVSIIVEALCYEPEGRGFDSR
jgi:hypothetical protein